MQRCEACRVEHQGTNIKTRTIPSLRSTAQIETVKKSINYQWFPAENRTFTCLKIQVPVVYPFVSFPLMFPSPHSIEAETRQRRSNNKYEQQLLEKPKT